MRIGIIAHLKYPISEPFAGGLEMHTHLLARSLRLRGHDVTLFASARSDNSLGLRVVCDETESPSAATENTPNTVFFKEHQAYSALMSEIGESDFDIIHNNSLHYLPLSMAARLPMPMVTTLHTPPFAELERGVREASSTAFVAVSNSIRAAWSAITAVDRVILNGIDLRRFSYRARADSHPYLIWYGRIVPEKGLHLALDAARLLSAELRFAGPLLDPDYFQVEIAPRLTAQTRYLGHLTHRDLAGAIAGAQVSLCTPRWEEPYGLVVAEALACGVPVAAFARGALPEIVDAHSGVLAAPDDPQSLADAVRRARGLGRRDCRKRAEEICDARSMIDDYEQLYEDMIDRKKQPNPMVAVPRSIRLGSTPIGLVGSALA